MAFVASAAGAGKGTAAAPTLKACIGAGGAKPCKAPAIGSLTGVSSLALSPDGKSLYASAYASDTVLSFRRSGSGKLKLQGCVADAGANGCADPALESLEGTGGLAVSPGGGDLYVTAGLGRSLTRFSRGSGGSLSFGACTADAGRNGCLDPTLDPLLGASAVAIGGDGSDLYVASFDGGAVTHLTRAPDGSMPTADCLADDGNFGCTDTPGSVLEGAAGIVLDPKGRDVYVAAASSRALVHLRRAKNGSLSYRECWAGLGANGCKKLPVDALLGASGIAMSPDGKRIFVASQAGTVTSFARSKNGKVKFVSCLGDDGKDGCKSPKQDSIRQATGIAAVGDDLYVASQGSDSITRIAVDGKGKLTWLSCLAPRKSVKGCAKAPAAPLDGAYAVASQGKSLYAAAPLGAALSTLSLPKR